jgi:CRP/FNR family cyclic AMP-dependent transcriptional regulator
MTLTDRNYALKEKNMGTSTTTVETSSRYEDVLAHLPASKTTEYNKGQMIYDLDNRPRSIFLVVKGTVGISHMAEDGTEVLLEIVRTDELFGESAFLDLPRRSERAQAIEKAELMTWPISEMEELVTKRPRLAVALLQVVALRNAEYTRRIESFAIDSIERRLARSLLRFSERLGTQEESGSVWMIPLTQEMLSRYIGTSREVVSHHMNRFRKHGYVNYSRRGISLHRETLKTVLD